MQAPEQENEAARGTGGGWAPSESGSERSEGSRRSGRTVGGHSEARSGAGHAVREVVVPMPSREDLGTPHLEPPLVRVTLAPRQPDPAWTQRVAPGPDRRQRHLSAVWDLPLEARGVQGVLRISFPCPIVVMGGSNLSEGQEPVGMFAYWLVSGHWRVQTAVARNGEEGTVTTAGVLGLNVITGWQQRRAEWVDVVWLAMRVHVGRQRKGGVDVIDVEGEEDAPPHPLGPEAESPPPPRKGTPMPPPESPTYGYPGGAGGRAGAKGGGGGVGGAAA